MKKSTSSRGNNKNQRTKRRRLLNDAMDVLIELEIPLRVVSKMAYTYTFKLEFSFEFHVGVKLKPMKAGARLLLASPAFRFPLPRIPFALV